MPYSFISQSGARRVDKIVKRLKGNSASTTAQGRAAAFSGVVVRFVAKGNSTRLRITDMASLSTLSSKLSRAAEPARAEKIP